MKYAGKTRLYDYRSNMLNENENEWADPGHDHNHNHNQTDHANTYDPTNVPLAMAIMPFQRWGPLFEPGKGFRVGTIFPELDYPFEQGRGGALRD